MHRWHALVLVQALLSFSVFLRSFPPAFLSVVVWVLFPPVSSFAVSDEGSSSSHLRAGSSSLDDDRGSLDDDEEGAVFSIDDDRGGSRGEQQRPPAALGDESPTMSFLQDDDTQPEGGSPDHGNTQMRGTAASTKRQRRSYAEAPPRKEQESSGSSGTTIIPSSPAAETIGTGDDSSFVEVRREAPNNIGASLTDLESEVEVLADQVYRENKIGEGQVAVGASGELFISSGEEDQLEELAVKEQVPRTSPSRPCSCLRKGGAMHSSS